MKTARWRSFAIVAAIAGWTLAGGLGLRTSADSGVQTPMKELRAHSATAQQLFQKVTAAVWSTRPRNDDGSADYYVHTYLPNGTYTIRFVTDHPVEPEHGRWNLQKDARGNWYVFHEHDHSRLPVDAELGFGEKFLAAGSLKADPKFGAATLPALELPDDIKNTVEKLTAQAWKRANAVDTIKNPSTLRFDKNWDIVETYAGKSKTVGYWYLMKDRIMVQYDRRLGEYEFRLFYDGRMIFNESYYVPASRPNSEGLLYFSTANGTTTEIKYPMPVQKQVPARLEVTITFERNDVKLQRFALTSQPHSYRNPDGTLAIPQEIVSMDCKDVVMAAGNRCTFPVDVTFPESGDLVVFFHILAINEHRNWDRHEERVIAVQSEAAEE